MQSATSSQLHVALQAAQTTRIYVKYNNIFIYFLLYS